jgi:hypothetical protein
MAVDDVTVNVAGVPLNETAVVPPNPVPLIATLVPAGPLSGVNPVIVGGTGTPLTNAFSTFAVIC